MKKFISYFKILALVLLAGIQFSCNDDDDNLYAGAPEIDMVSASVDENGQALNPLVSTNMGYANNTYIIKGRGFASLKHIYFNDHESYFNPNLVTDNTIIVTVDINTPYVNGNNKLKLVTNTGSVEYNFIIAPPAPIFRGFQPVNAADGETITIKGNYFVDPTVKVGDMDAQIISYTLTEIKVKLPAGSQDKKVTVTTLSGNNTWGTAVGTAIYDDAFYAPWDMESWNNHEYVTDPDNAFQGDVFIKKQIDGWGNIQSNWNSDANAVTKYTGIKFAVRSDGPGKLIFVFNSQFWGDASKAFTTSDDWVEVKYKWSDLGNPAAVQFLGFQEFSGAQTTYYFDNFTYTTD
ncbi:IPT/TIG domain-containing protein [Chryseobacterium sp. CT-SW4]|uniref:IPT/TIG domain-containing protein n=1 Tax=Chryseobacterium sp. SW-1 TaxID=3157343 RepID=UPI003B0210DE